MISPPRYQEVVTGSEQFNCECAEIDMEKYPQENGEHASNGGSDWMLFGRMIKIQEDMALGFSFSKCMEKESQKGRGRGWKKQKARNEARRWNAGNDGGRRESHVTRGVRTVRMELGGSGGRVTGWCVWSPGGTKGGRSLEVVGVGSKEGRKARSH